MSEVEPNQAASMLAETIANENDLEYILFYGHHDITKPKSCLSQWYDSGFTEGDNYFKTAEHYMMWRKAKLFGDKNSMALILACERPSEAKILGRAVTGFKQAIWDVEDFGIVVDGNILKFDQNEIIKSYLISTKQTVLVEASKADKRYGIGMYADNTKASTPSKWKGENKLGFALMVARMVLAGRVVN